MTRFFDLPATCSRFVGLTLSLRREAFYTDEDIQWFDPQRQQPGLVGFAARSLACLIRGEDGPDLYLMFNADSEPIDFVLPTPPRPAVWRLAVDTAQGLTSRLLCSGRRTRSYKPDELRR